MIEDRLQILIVDDEECLRRNLQEYLEDEDFTVFTAGSAEEGMEILKTMSIDVSIVDIRLPGIDGFAFITQAHDLYPGIKFLIYTGSICCYCRLTKEYRLINNIAESDVFQKPVNNLSFLVSRIRCIDKGVR